MRGYLVTDRDCGFCQSSGAWLERNFGTTWKNTPATAELLERFGITAQEAATSVWFVVTDNNATFKRYSGSDAVARAVTSRGGVWRLALVGTVPPLSWLAQAVYKVIARNRHRLPGASPSCELER